MKPNVHGLLWFAGGQAASRPWVGQGLVRRVAPWGQVLLDVGGLALPLQHGQLVDQRRASV